MQHALLQRRGGVGRAWRASRSGDPHHSNSSASGDGETAERFGLRFRLCDAGRNMRARLRTHLRFGDGTPAGDGSLEGTRSLAYNLGNGNGFSVRQVIAAARKITGRAIPVIESPRRAGDPPVLVASSAKIGKEQGWKPKYATLESILETAWSGTRPTERLRRVCKLLIRAEDEMAVERGGQPDFAVVEISE